MLKRFGRRGVGLGRSLLVDDATRRSLPWFYRCIGNNCGRELRFSQVLHIAVLRDKNGARKLDIRYTCQCSRYPLRNEFDASGERHAKALARLVWPNAVLIPYVAADVSKRPPKFVNADIEAAAVRFGWDCAQLRDVDEFLLFSGHPEERGDAGEDGAPE